MAVAAVETVSLTATKHLNCGDMYFCQDEKSGGHTLKSSDFKSWLIWRHTHTHTVTMVTADTPWVANLSEIQPCRAAGAPPLQCSQTNSRCFNSEVIKRYSLHEARVVFPQQQQVTVKLVTLLEELDVCIPSPSAHPTAHCSRDWMFPYCGEKY